MRDSQGNARPSIAGLHRAMAPSKNPKMTKMATGGKDDAAMPPMGGKDGGGSGHSELHPHGDGTYHTVTNGQETQHPHIGHALAHLAGQHASGEKHFNAHHDGMNVTSHHVGEDGQVQGPMEHDPNNVDSLRKHMDQFLSEEGSEGGEPEMEPMMHGGGGSLY